MDNLIINDRYVIENSIGHGGYSTVFLAFDKYSNMHVAIKLLKCDITKEKRAEKMFNQEAMTLASLNNKNILKVYNSGVYNNQPFLVMEYVKGCSLKEIIMTRGYLLVDEVFSYTKQILSGVEACHNNNIIHRDIKPHNIIKKSDGTMVIIDFGLAFLNDPAMNLYEENENFIACTVQYMAPELINHPEGTFQTDIYAIGVTMFEMFTGRHPYILNNKDDKKSVIMMHINSPFPSVRNINPEVPESFEKIINKCCEKDPKNRYKNVNEIYIELLIAYNEYKNPKKEKKSFFKRLFKKGK